MITFEVKASGLQTWIGSPAELKARISTTLGKVGALVTSEVKSQLSMGPDDRGSFGDQPFDTGKRGKPRVKSLKGKDVRLDVFPFPRNSTDHLRVRTGRLRGSIGFKVDPTLGAWSVSIGPMRTTKYAAVHEFGSQMVVGGPIRPIHAKRLRFPFEGGWVFAKEVVIPARPFLGPALEKSIDPVVNLLESGLGQAITKG